MITGRRASIGANFEFETNPVVEQVEVRSGRRASRGADFEFLNLNFKLIRSTTRDLQSILNKKHITRRFVD